MKFKALIFSSVIAAALVFAGCASTGYNKASSATTSIEQTGSKLRQGSEQIDTVLIALSNLINSPEADIRPQYQQFNSAVNELEKLSDDVNKNAAAMQVQGADYFGTWDEELAKISNENIRRRSTERKNEVATRFDGVRAKYEQARADFAPFMSDLMDIRTALAMDLTAGGLVSIRASTNKANENARPLRQSLNELAADLSSLGMSLSATTPRQASNR